MRAFLREPSTPWIVFDQEGRPPSHIAVGDVFPAVRRSLLSEHGFFPATAAIDAAAAEQSRLEPSSLAVAADLLNDAHDTHDTPIGDRDDAVSGAAIPRRGLSRRYLGAAAALAAMLCTVGLGSLILESASGQLPSAKVAGAANVADLAPPAFDVNAAAAAALATPSAPAAAPPRDDSPAKAAAKKYGRLTVAGDARSRDVFMDGKRMLGRGARSFTVMCGTHTIAVGTRADVRDVEIPCTGAAELVVEK